VSCTQVEFVGPVSQRVVVNSQRVAISNDDERFVSSEFQRSVFARRLLSDDKRNFPPIVTDSEVLVELTRSDRTKSAPPGDDELVGRLRLASYLQPLDPLYFAASSKAVSISDYSLKLMRLRGGDVGALLQTTSTRRVAAAALLLPPLLAGRPRVSRAEEGPSAPLAATRTAIFSAGDPRFLQPVFEDIRYLGVLGTSCGKLADGTPAVRVEYDAKKLSYKRVLGAFWRGVDPTNSQPWQSGPTIIYTSNAEEQRLAEGSRRRLDISGLYKVPILTEVRLVDGANAADATFVEDEAASGWFVREGKLYEKQRSKSGRAQWFDDTYKPIKTTACEAQSEGGTVCGFVYFPCTEENGCRGVLQGTWE
jgi:hypothetical protein